MDLHVVRRIASGALTVPLALTLSLIPADAQYSPSPPADELAVQDRDWSDDVPAHLAYVDGTVTLEREGRLEPAETNLGLLAGDRLRTKGGRVEILYADGSVVTVDEYSELDLLSDSLVRLLEGRMRLTISRAASGLDYRIDAPAASIWIRTPGEYRIDVGENRSGEPEVGVDVLRGSAELVNEHGRTLVRAGMRAVATPRLAPSLPYVTNSASWDEFDRWSDDQRSFRVGRNSTRYLPTELSYYGGAFDTYGNWDYVAPHGYVWYPRVASGWRPYGQGRWSFAAHFGWFWVGIDRWSWPTHHYGRWGVSSAGWYWIPDRRWAPAWVSWGTAPGYVAWCPLGWDGRPVYGFRYADPWWAWNIIPARVLVPNVWVTQNIVVHNVIPPSVRAQFIERRTAPAIPVAYARRIDPIRSPTASRGFAVPRNARPAYDGEEAWRSRAVGASATSRAIGPAVGAPARDPNGRSSQPEAGRPRANPSRTRTAPAGGIEVPRIEVPQSGLSRPSPSAPEVRRAVPRREETPDRPSTFGTPSRAPERNVPPPSAESPRARSRTPSYGPPPPPQQQRGEPSRGGSRAPERTEPSRSAPAPPPSARGRDASPPPSSPPAARGRGSAPPPPPTARGGGLPGAVPRARGGGGGGGGTE